MPPKTRSQTGTGAGPSSDTGGPTKSPKKSLMSAKSENGGRRLGAGGLSKEEEEEDTKTILAAVADFRDSNGSIPTPGTMKPEHEAVSGSLHYGNITVGQLYNNFRTMKRRYNRALDSGVGPAPLDRASVDLSVRACGEPKRRNPQPSKSMHIEEEIVTNGVSPKKRKVAAEEEDGGGGGDFKYLTDQSIKYWKMQGMSMPDLELGLKFMDKSKAAVLEGKWRSFFREELKIKSKYHDAHKDVLAALSNTEGLLTCPICIYYFCDRCILDPPKQMIIKSFECPLKISIKSPAINYHPLPRQLPRERGPASITTMVGMSSHGYHPPTGSVGS